MAAAPSSHPTYWAVIVRDMRWLRCFCCLLGWVGRSLRFIVLVVERLSWVFVPLTRLKHIVFDNWERFWFVCLYGIVTALSILMVTLNLHCQADLLTNSWGCAKSLVHNQQPFVIETGNRWFLQTYLICRNWNSIMVTVAQVGRHMHEAKESIERDEKWQRILGYCLRNRVSRRCCG